MSDGNVGYPEHFRGIDEAWLRGWQDSLTATAKDIIYRKRLVPMVFMLTLPERIQDGFRSKLKRVDSAVDSVTLDGVDYVVAMLPDYVVAMLPVTYDWESMFDLATEYLVAKEKRPLIRVPMEASKEFGITPEEGHRAMTQALLGLAKMNEQDLMAIHIRSVLKKVGAMAYVKIDDGYALHVQGTSEEEVTARTSQQTSLAHEEAASEAVMSQMETPTFARLLTVPYKRTQRNTGKVVGFGEQKEMTARRDGKSPSQLSGRFMWMLEAPV